MDQCEDREEGVPPSKTTLCGEHESHTKAQRNQPEPTPSCVSLKSSDSKDHYVDFKAQQASAAERVNQESSEIPSGQACQQHQMDIDPIFMLLQNNIITFVRNELERIQKALSSCDSEYLECQKGCTEVLEGEDEVQRKSTREAFMKITLHFLRRMKKEKLADHLQSRTSIRGLYWSQHELKSNLKNKVQCVFEGIAKAGNF